MSKAARPDKENAAPKTRKSRGNFPLLTLKTTDWSHATPASRDSTDGNTMMWEESASDHALHMFGLEELTKSAFTDLEPDNPHFAMMATNDMGYKRVVFIRRDSPAGTALADLLTRIDMSQPDGTVGFNVIEGGYNRFSIVSMTHATLWGAWENFYWTLFETATSVGNVSPHIRDLRAAAEDFASLRQIGLRAPLEESAEAFRKAKGPEKARLVTRCVREAQLTMYMHAHDLTPTIVGQYMTEAGLHVLMESGFDLKAVLDLAAVADEGYSEEMRTHARNVEHLLWKASFSPVNALLLDLKLGNVVMVPRVDGGSEKLSPRLIDFDGSFSRIMKAQNAPQDICVYTINTTLLLLSFVCETAKKYKLVDKKLYGAYALFAQQLRESFVRRVKAYKEFTDNDDVDTGAICNELQRLLMGDASTDANLDAETTSMGVAMTVLRAGMFYLQSSARVMQLCTEIEKWDFDTQKALWPQLVKLSMTPTEDLVESATKGADASDVENTGYASE